MENYEIFGEFSEISENSRKIIEYHHHKILKLSKSIYARDIDTNDALVLEKQLILKATLLYVLRIILTSRGITDFKINEQKWNAKLLEVQEALDPTLIQNLLQHSQVVNPTNVQLN